jgi:hypothetical protein
MRLHLAACSVTPLLAAPAMAHAVVPDQTLTPGAMQEPRLFVAVEQDANHAGIFLRMNLRSETCCRRSV